MDIPGLALSSRWNCQLNCITRGIANYSASRALDEGYAHLHARGGKRLMDPLIRTLDPAHIGKKIGIMLKTRSRVPVNSSSQALLRLQSSLPSNHGTDTCRKSARVVPEVMHPVVATRGVVPSGILARSARSIRNCGRPGSSKRNRLRCRLSRIARSRDRGIWRRESNRHWSQRGRPHSVTNFLHVTNPFW